MSDDTLEELWNRAKRLLEGAVEDVRSALLAGLSRQDGVLERPRMGTSHSRLGPLPIYVDHAAGAHLTDIEVESTWTATWATVLRCSPNIWAPESCAPWTHA